MRIFLIRHTRVAVPRGICYGFSDVDLAATYPEDLADVRRRSAGLWHRPQIVTSPLTRAARLAHDLFGSEPHAGDPSLPPGPVPRQDARLKELNFGDWELRAWDSLPPEELGPWTADFTNARAPGGETYRELLSRSTACLEAVVAEGLTAAIDEAVLVAHGGVLRCLISAAIKLPLEHTFSLHIEFGGISCLEVSGDQRRLLFMNR